MHSFIQDFVIEESKFGIVMKEIRADKNYKEENNVVEIEILIKNEICKEIFTQNHNR